MGKFMSKITFLCELPPPFGGVTVKNQVLLKKVLPSDREYSIIDFCAFKRNKLSLFAIIAKMLVAFVRKDTIIYGFGSYSRLTAALSVQKLIGGKKSLSKTIYIVMGGSLYSYIRNHSKKLRMFKALKANLVESPKMKEDCFKVGLNNTCLYPNVRSIDGSVGPTEHGDTLRCVFFSKVCVEKGMRYISSEFENLKDCQISLDIYGHIAPNYESELEALVKKFTNISYKGVFDSVNHNVYKLLNSYDVLLLPTRWMEEGIPGILIEAKMSGITSVVSDFNYNKEVINNGRDGIILDDLETGTLSGTLRELYADRGLLKTLKQGSFESKDKYAAEAYADFFGELLM